jgi:hypothetical protein
MNRVEKMAAHVVGPGDPKRLTEEREHGGYLEIHGGLLSILPHLRHEVETWTFLLGTHLRFEM